MPKIFFVVLYYCIFPGFPLNRSLPLSDLKQNKISEQIGKPRFKRCILAQCSGIGWFIFNLPNAEFLHTGSAQYPASCGFSRLDAMLRRKRNYCQHPFPLASSMRVHLTPISKRQMTSLSFVLQETIAKLQL